MWRFLLVLCEGPALGLVTVLLTSLRPAGACLSLASSFCFPWGYLPLTVCFEHLMNNGHSFFSSDGCSASRIPVASLRNRYAALYHLLMFYDIHRDLSTSWIIQWCAFLFPKESGLWAIFYHWFLYWNSYWVRLCYLCEADNSPFTKWPWWLGISQPQ